MRSIEPNIHGRSDGGEAFLPDPYAMGRHSKGSAGITSETDDLAEEFGEDFVSTVTSAEDVALENRDALVDEEFGGPFVESNESEEFAPGYDAANPAGAEVAPFPIAVAQSKERDDPGR